MQKNIDIVLIHPPRESSVWEKKLGSKLPPIGLASLAGYLREQGIGVTILDALNLGLNEAQVLEYIREKKPAYVGITATTNMITDAASIAEKIKAISPGIVTIIGGSHVSAMPVETMEKFSVFDIGVYGEGEITLHQIMEADKINKGINGIVFRDNGSVVQTADRDFIKDLDTLPYPAYDLLPDFPDFYRPTPNNYSALPVAPIISSRGCPYSCTFCDRAVFGQKWRSHSIDYLISLIKHLQERYNISEICFYDDIFLIKKEKLYEFIEKKINRNIQFSWSCEGRIDQMDEQMLKDMKKSGCWQINYGIESGSQTILETFNKKITVDQIWKTLRATKKAGLHSRAYLIIGAPTETMHTLKETRDMIKSVPLSDIHISFFTPLPGAALYKEIIGEIDTEQYHSLNQYLISYIPPGVTEKALHEFMSSLYREFYLHPRRLFRYAFMVLNRHKSVHLLKSGFAFISLTFGRN